VFAAPESGLRGPPAALTPVANFYVVSKNFSDPIVDSRSWKLSIHGKVERPFSLGYDAFHALPATTETATLECVSNNVGGDLISTGLFAGPPLRDLVAMASPSGDADAVALRSRDGYTETIALGLVGADASILVAHTLDGAPLPDRHGFPARVLFPGHYGMRGPKWLEDIELVKGDGGGYWEGQGWSHDATVKTTARIDTPADGATLARGAITIAGVAFAGTRGISAVEVSTDRGRSWRPAELGETPSPLSWTLWTFAWTPASGAYTVVVRARDGSGALQSAIVAPSFPSGASGYHSIHVNVT
jgi:DMSO/TMAO reductase YedYZ molybdopterin-dependent catalytic subunit